MKIAVIGAASIDHYILLDTFPEDDSMSFANEHHTYIGGSGANIALNLSVESEVDFYFGTGTDSSAKHILEQLRDSKLRLFYHTEEGPGAYTLVMVNREGQRRIVSLGGKALFDGITEVKEYQAVCIAESFRSVAEGAFQRFPHALKVYVPGGCGFYFGNDTVVKLSNQADFVIFSNSESTLLGADIDTIRSKVLITRGSEDTLFRDENGNVFSFAVTPVSGSVIDTTGAGDAFCSGFVRMYAMTGNVSQSVHHGHYIASRVISQLGPNLFFQRRERDEKCDS